MTCVQSCTASSPRKAQRQVRFKLECPAPVHNPATLHTGAASPPNGQDLVRIRQELMASAEFRDMLGGSDAFRHSCFLSQDAEALLRITRRVPQKRLQGTNRTNSMGSSRQNSSSSQPSHPTSVATAAAAMATLSQSGQASGGNAERYTFPPHIPQYATAPHAVRLHSDPYMHSHPPGGEAGDSGGFTSFKYTRAGGHAANSAPPSMGHVGQPGAPPRGPVGAASALNAPPNGWSSEVRMHSGNRYAAVPVPPVPGSAGWHAPWQGTMWGGAPPSHRTNSWSPRAGAPHSSSNPEQPGSLSPRSARDYIDWAPAASLPSGHVAPSAASAAPGRSGEPTRYQPGAVARSAFTAGGGEGGASGRPPTFLDASRMASGDSCSPRFLAQTDVESNRSRSRSPRPLSRPGAHGPAADYVLRHNSMRVVHGVTDAGALASMPNVSIQSGRSTSPRPAWFGGEPAQGGGMPPVARRSVSPRPAALAQSLPAPKAGKQGVGSEEFAVDELPRGQAITL